MLYCVQCGKQVGDADQFCGGCGARQRPSAGPAGNRMPPRDSFANISDRNAALFCYVPILGWIASVIVLASDRYKRDHRIRFHAFQGLFLFAAWLLVDWVLSPMLSAPGWEFGFFRMPVRLLKLALVGAGVFMMIRVSHDDDYHLPVVGELAERAVSEQGI
jgi:uncharacterized membrane protein